MARWKRRPEGSTWGDFGPDDQIGRLNLITREKVLEGIIATIPVGRLGEPEDIARGVVYLAADDAGFITGSTLTINGAQYIAG